MAETEPYVLELNTFICVCVDPSLLFQSLFVFNSSKSLFSLLVCFGVFLYLIFLTVIGEYVLSFTDIFKILFY